MKSQNLAVWLLLIIAATGCGNQNSSAAKITKQLQGVKSWTATAEMVGDNWMEGNVPNAYAQQTLETAEHEIEKEKIDLLKKRSNINLVKLQKLQETVGEMAIAVEHRDRSNLAQRLQELKGQKQALNSLGN